MAKIKQLKDKSGTEQIFPKTKTQAIYNTDGTLLSETLDDLYGSLATIESSPTTTSHSVGEYILYEGQVYKVTSVIASGDSLVVGTNISAVNLGDQISTLNSKTTWKFLDKKTGTGNPINYSSITFSELLVIVNIGDSGNKESFYIPKVELTGINWWRAGGYTTVQTPALVTISTGASSVQLTNASQGTTDYSSTSTISVYYR